MTVALLVFSKTDELNWIICKKRVRERRNVGLDYLFLLKRLTSEILVYWSFRTPGSVLGLSAAAFS